MAARVLRRGAGALIALGVRAAARLETDGLDEECGDLGKGPLIVINHRSFLDPLVVVTLCRRYGVWPYTFAREDFFDRPFSRTVLRVLRAIPALRGRSALGGLRRAERLLADGQVVVIAAEGRIVPDHERSDGVGELFGGAAWLGYRTSEMVVLTLTGTDDAWPVERRLPRWKVLARPTVTVRARRVSLDPGMRGHAITAVIRATMSELIDGA
ncbi:lysophospholipid acyltransferase family protein [Streptomyces sp. NPDC048277]|uniref:lysophospholipid acyltransferase family protein n=1 Tax=Streptomyces sp. NPDC048277 TaxID=3155027 RepID=UPI0033F987B2